MNWPTGNFYGGNHSNQSFPTNPYEMHAMRSFPLPFQQSFPPMQQNVQTGNAPVPQFIPSAMPVSNSSHPIPNSYSYGNMRTQQPFFPHTETFMQHTKPYPSKQSNVFPPLPPTVPFLPNQSFRNASPVLQSFHPSSTKSSLQDSQKTSDQFMVERFLSKIGKLNLKNTGNKRQTSTAVSQSKCIKIWEAKKLHARAHYLTQKFEAYLKNPKDDVDFNDNLVKYKSELERILSILSDEEVIKGLQDKLLSRKKKRNRIKRKRHQTYLAKQRQLERIEKANKKISEWQKQEQIKLEEQTREQELQRQLDEALHELRKELSTITKSLEMVNALASLRKVRFNTLKDKGGELPSSTVTERFNETTNQIKATLLCHKRSVTNKIDSLKVYLETEHEREKLAIEKKKAKQRLEMQMKLENERRAVLFGKQKQLDPFDPLWPVQEVHKQAEKSISSLVQYRRLWDQFLHEEGSAIPVDWVEPVEPTDEEWAKYLIKPEKDAT